MTEPETHRPPRALVVDDDPSARGFFERLLSLEGYDVTPAANGLEASALLGAARFDIVVSDITMPGMGGIQLLHRVREVDLDVPVILITGKPSVETAAKAVEYGALRYLLKPVKTSELRKVVNDARRLHELAKIKREALALHDRADMATDLAGLEAHFKRALASLTMVYQPIVRRSKRETWAFEALARTGESSLRGPEEMLSAANRLGREAELGRAIREEVANAFHRIGPDALVFVNVNPRELDDEALYAFDAPLAAHAKRVVLELTERARLEDIARLSERVTTLRHMGYRFAIDDLGSGYASLQTFVHIQPEVAKIDMSLIRGIHLDSTKRRIVQSIVQLCEGLDVELIAEGIETPEERDCVSELGIDLMQGYYFSRPEPEFVKPSDSSLGIDNDSSRF